ncbi:hypothetical protein [Arthrobacter sp. B1I2]|uniref:hypothetical protein n=1 Tax=Arthrobacter sp. B1I2 TaxID=3042263 RepID=UPI0027D80CAA|nr:hypothetical protein [Arthrobacter sp. B1I2]
MSKIERTAKNAETPAQLTTLIGLSVACALAAILTVFVLLNSMGPAHQAFWSGLVGSLVGSLLAFILAIVLWTIERKVVVRERILDRREAREDDLRRSDLAALRSCLALVGHIRALRYGLPNEDPHVTARDRYLFDIKVQEAVSLIRDGDLQEDTQFIARLVSNDEAVAYYVSPNHARFHVAADWLVRLINCDSQEPVTAARPHDYAELCKGFEQLDEDQEEQRAEDAYSEAERAQAAECASAGTSDSKS